MKTLQNESAPWATTSATRLRCRAWTAAVALFPIMLTSVSGAAAQDAGSLMREQERRRELERLERLPDPQVEDSDVEPETPVAAAQAGSDETIVVSRLRFAGDTALLGDSEFAALAAEVQGRELSVAGFLALTDKITAALQQNGRILARAVLPPQDVTGGEVTIEIIDGVLEETVFESDAGVRIREESLRRLFDRGVRPHAVTKKDLERTLLRVNDFPGVTASGRLQPGDNSNTSRLVVSLDEAPAISTTVWTDNYGDPSTGRPEVTGLLALTDLSGRGEQYYVRGALSEGMKVASASASAPPFASGVTLHGDYTYVAYESITDIGEQLALEGRSKRIGVGVEHDFVRSRPLNLRWSFDLGFKELVDESLAGLLSDRRSSSGTLRLSGDTRDDILGGGFNTFDAGVTFGDLDLSRMPAEQAADAAGLQTEGHFRVVSASFVRLQELPGKLSLLGRFYGQAAGKNLDSSEEFSLGGPYGVRAYPGGEGRGDMGLVGTIELRYDIVAPGGGDLQFATFVDRGRVRVNEDSNGIPIATATGRNDYSLRGAGLSLRWTHQRTSISTAVARTLGSNPGRSVIDGTNSDGRDDEWSYWLQGIVRF